MGNIDKIALSEPSEAFCSKTEHLRSFVHAHFADTLKSHLQDFTYFARIFQRSVNVFMVKYLFRAVGRLYAFDDGKRNVRLQRHQLSVKITERNDIIAHKEIFVFHI